MNMHGMTSHASRLLLRFIPVIGLAQWIPICLAVTCVSSIPPSNPDSAYAVHGDGTVTDTRTGLMWKVCVEGQTWSDGSCAGAETTHTWEHSLALAGSAFFAGHGDWRLPNPNELDSLVEECRVNPSINDSVFPAASGNLTWTGSPSATISNSAWYIGFSDGYRDVTYRGDTLVVRLVRGGQSFCSSLVTISGRVKDATTGQPLSGVTVNLDTASTVSAGDGSYSFSGIAGGTRYLTVTVPGYASGGTRVTVACNNVSQDIHLTKASTTNGLATQSGYAADPVNTATGNYVFSRTDLKISGRGFPFAFERTYNSQDPQPGALGYGWTHNFNSGYTVDGGGNVILRLGDGKTVTFAPNGSGGFTPQYGVFDTLTADAAGYLLTRKDRSRHRFDGTGRLVSIADRNGNTQTLTYTGSLLTQVTDTAGRPIAFTYDGGGRITRIIDPLGRIVSFGYDIDGNLAASNDPAGGVTIYTYDASHQLLTATDPRGNVFVTNAYDATQRVVTSQHDAKGGVTTYAYDSTTRRTTITNPLGQVSYHTHDSLLRLIEDTDPLGAALAYAYDAAGNRTQITDRNSNVTRYAYDAAGNVTQKTDALGAITTITYDASHNPLTRTDALGNVTTFAYDPQGNLLTTTDALGGITRITYNVAGQPLTVTDARGNVTTQQYDSEGNLSRVTDAQGGITQYGYDPVGRRTSRTDALGRITTTAYDANDNVVAVTNPAGLTESYAYDGNNNRIAVTDRLGRVITTAYDEKDLPTTVTNALGGTTTTAYDALDRRISLTDPRGFVTQFGYDAAGRQISRTNALGQVTQSDYDPEGNRWRIVDPLGHSNTFIYDPLKRPYQATDPLGNVTTTGYDVLGRVVTTTNAKGQTTARFYDALGRLVDVPDAGGGIVSYLYDAVGNRTAMSDPRGNWTYYVYDALNRLITKTDPGGYQTQYIYDLVGNRTRVIRPDGRSIHYAYDLLDRLTTVTYPDGFQLQFAYDAVGKRITMTDRIGTTSYSYDALDRLTGTTDPYGKTVGYQYDASGNLTQLTYPDGKQVSYVYDGLNRLTGLTDWASRSHSYSYDAAGRVVGATLPNGTTAEYGYDAADRLTGLSHRLGAATPFASYVYSLDPLGNPTQATGSEPLAPLFTAGTVSYGYDADSRQIAVGSTAQGFDALGNLIASGPARYVWDDDDRLKQSSFGIATQSYQYNGVGNRMSRTVNGTQTRYVLDTSGPLSKVLAETTAAGAISAYYVYGLGLVERVAADGSVRYYHQDSRGSTVALTDSAGTITDRYAYDPFGRLANSAGTTANPFKFVGQYGLMDDGSGLTYIRARYYQPERGRFLSKDPKPGSDTDTQSLHRYVYAMNNPIRLVDVSGYSPLEVGSRARDYASRRRQALIRQIMAHNEMSATIEAELAYLDAAIEAIEATRDAALGLTFALSGPVSWVTVTATGSSLLTRTFHQSGLLTADAARRTRAAIGTVTAVKGFVDQIQALRVLAPAIANVPVNWGNVLLRTNSGSSVGRLYTDLYGDAIQEGFKQIGEGIGSLLFD
jgi:RHS repeat-associated protein